MIDPKLLRNNIEAVNLALAKRGVQLDVAEWADLEARRKEIQSKTETLQAERNAGAKQVGQLKKAGGENVPVIRCESYDEVVNTARSIAKDGDTVLLSPASTSFDMFNNFEERGNLFKKLVNELN